MIEIEKTQNCISKIESLINTLKNHLKLYEKYEKNKEFIKQIHNADKSTAITIKYYIKEIILILDNFDL